MQKRYMYRFYDGGQFNGAITEKDVEGYFEYDQDINTLAVEIDVDVPLEDFVVSPTLSFDSVVDENGNDVVDENGNIIISAREYTLFGGRFDVGFRFEVWLFDDSNPTGIRKFDGIVMGWKIKDSAQILTISAISNGIRAKNALVQILPNELVVDHNIADSTFTMYPKWKTALSRTVGLAQTINLPGDTTFRTIQLGFDNPNTDYVPVLINIVKGTPTSREYLLSSLTRYIPPSTGELLTDVILPTSVTFAASTTYFIEVLNQASAKSAAGAVSMGVDTTGAYTDGAAYTYNDSTGWTVSSGNDLRFTIRSDTGALGNVFINTDPSAMVRRIADNFAALGGPLNYTADSIIDTNTTINYTYKFITVADAWQKALENSPGDFWYAVNPGHNTLTFKPQGVSADHVFIRGVHLQDIDLEYTINGMKNLSYFSGGDRGDGINVSRSDENPVSRQRYGQWLNQTSDNRVTTDAQAATQNQSIINREGFPRFRTEITVLADVYDIETIDVGQMVALRSKNALYGSLLFQIASIKKTPHFVSLRLDTKPPRLDSRIEENNRRLLALETINNPDS